MPQMAPMNWLIMFTIFILTFIIINMMNYYIFNSKPSYTESKKIHKSLSWKW
uniref:ATP synthase complex subunit 8 n=1 Tax=Manticora tibialis TaxID=1343345 RepID=A0A343EZ15_9CARA|nr:ATP synthase F0 subunit 8 [Manticora tibialis]ASN65992.1 ATP synthase F0 subunit 8 [Manticora tibialis]